jgi:hypothetical protein
MTLSDHRYLIMLLKRAVAELRKLDSAASSPKAVCENQPTPNPGGESSAQTGNSKPAVPPTPSSLTAPRGDPHYGITPPRPEKTWWDKIKPLVEIAGIVLLFVYTVYTVKMYRANKEAADAAKSAADTAANALYVTEVADIEPDHFECSTSPNPLGTESSVALIFRNTGRGSATNMEGYAYMGFYGDHLRELPNDGSTVTVGAGIQFPSPMSKVADTVRDFRMVNDKTHDLHLWGWFKYRDRFGHSHILVYDTVYVPKTACRFNIVTIVSR